MQCFNNKVMLKICVQKVRKIKYTSCESNWTKKNIFFKLEYWSKLKIKRCLDVMHIEKKYI